jgi:predicted enzyme related to lactoylglutathione lyase
MTPDPAKAQAFYTRIAGWGTQAWEGPAPYTMWTVDGAPIGGVMPLPPATPPTPHWIAFIAVPDIDAAAKQAVSLGATVQHGPEDIPDVGRYAIVADPQGAFFGLFTPSEGAKPPEEKPPAVGQFSWHELSADDWTSAWTFYERMFGWEKLSEHDMGPMGVYVEFARNGRAIGGMFSRRPDMPTPNWLQYIRVDSVDRVVEVVKANGGQVVIGPTDVPGGDRIAQCLDPQGAAFALHSSGAP